MGFTRLILCLCGLSGALTEKKNDGFGGVFQSTWMHQDDTNEYFDSSKKMSDSEINLTLQSFQRSIRQLDKNKITKQVTNSFLNIVLDYFPILQRDPNPMKHRATLNVVDNLWSMYHDGKLQPASDHNSGSLFKLNRVRSFWKVLQFKVGAGSIVEIGGCQTTLDSSSDTNNTVLSILTDSQTLRSCTENNGNSADKNLFMGFTSIDNVQKWTEKLQTYPVLFGNVILNKVAGLSMNLLPHEFIQLLLRIFSVSRQIFLVDSSVGNQMQSYFEANWPRPKDLVEAVCEAGNLICYDITQSQGWNEERFVLQVTIDSHQRKLNPDFCRQYQSDGECYLEHSINKTKVVNQSNRTIVENINNNNIPLDIIPYQTEMSEKSLEDLLLKLLRQDGFSDIDPRNILLNGEKVTHQSIWKIKDNQQAVPNVDVFKTITKPEYPSTIKTESSEPVYQIETTPLNRRNDVTELPKDYDVTINEITDTVLTREERQIQQGLIYLTKAFKYPIGKTPRALPKILKFKPVTIKSHDNLSGNRIYNKIGESSTKIKYKENRVNFRKADSKEIIKETIPREHKEFHVLDILQKKKSKSTEKGTTATKPVFRKRKLLSISEHTKKYIKKFLKTHQVRPYRDSSKSRKRKVTKKSSISSEEMFDILWSIVRIEVINILNNERQSNIIVYGDEAYCLLSCKLTMMYPLANVITILPQQHIFNKCLKMADSVRHGTNVVFNRQLDPLLVQEIDGLPQIFDLQILGMDIFTNMLSTGQGFLVYLGKLLIQSKASILELPPFHQLQDALDIVANFRKINQSNNTGILLSVQGMIHHALQLVQADHHQVKILNLNSKSFNNRIVLIQLRSFNRKVRTDCKSKVNSIMRYNSGVYSDQDLSQPGISLQYLLSLELPPATRSSMFKKYLKLQILEDMCPINILWSNQTFIHRHLHFKLDDINQIQQSIDQLKSEIKDEQFLFLDINNNNKIVTYLSQEHKNSTFVSMRTDDKTGEDLYDVTTGIGINNIAVTTQELDDAFTEKLLHSPDIFRYSYLGYKEFLRNLMEQDRQVFDAILGNLISTSITSFIEVPSAQVISLAASTFFPEYFPPSSNQSIYVSDNHPLPEFIDIETDIIYQSAKADVKINIKTEIIPSINNNNNTVVLPWKLVRVDIQQLNVTVGHHFDYEEDGHSRSYNQHVQSENKTHYKVYLIRQMDQFLIPYGNVYAISLIALIRMGLIQQQKEIFYEKFLHLPLFEDMATWNIVFRHGNLEYIDFDTKNTFYDKILPSAAKIIAVLVNYQRTLSDLDKCGLKANNGQGFHYISKCINSEFTGPCNDLAYPVPCGDHTCRSTYIECLRALLAKKKLSEEGGQSLLQSKSSQWSFDKSGAIKSNKKTQ